MIRQVPVNIASTQCRALVLHINCSVLNLSHVYFRVLSGRQQPFQCRLILWRFSQRSLRDPHQITYLHPSGIVSRAIVRPPSLKACQDHPSQRQMPVFLHLHGAGLDIRNRTVEDMMSPIPDLPAWVLFPSGVTAWSGDDWRRFALSSQILN